MYSIQDILRGLGGRGRSHWDGGETEEFDFIVSSWCTPKIKGSRYGSSRAMRWSVVVKGTIQNCFAWFEYSLRFRVTPFGPEPMSKSKQFLHYYGYHYCEVLFEKGDVLRVRGNFFREGEKGAIRLKRVERYDVPGMQRDVEHDPDDTDTWE